MPQVTIYVFKRLRFRVVGADIVAHYYKYKYKLTRQVCTHYNTQNFSNEKYFTVDGLPQLDDVLPFLNISLVFL